MHIMDYIENENGYQCLKNIIEFRSDIRFLKYKIMLISKAKKTMKKIFSVSFIEKIKRGF